MAKRIESGNSWKWVLETGDLCYWIGDNGEVARCRVELITETWIYIVFTAEDAGWTVGQATRIHRRHNDRIAPRIAIEAKVTAKLNLKQEVYWDTIVTGPATPPDTPKR
ncbi:hypothetical protein ACQPZJ_35530 [Actinoplanes sp. CA-054009]